MKTLKDHIKESDIVYNGCLTLGNLLEQSKLIAYAINLTLLTIYLGSQCQEHLKSQNVEELLKEIIASHEKEEDVVQSASWAQSCFK